MQKRVKWLILENRKIIELKSKKTRNYYASKGYCVDSVDFIIVKVEDLPTHSHLRVWMTCDDCGAVSCIRWRDYKKSKKLKHYCVHCKGNHLNNDYQIKRSENWYHKATEFALKKGYTITTSEKDLLNAKSVIEFVCPIHGPHQTMVYCFCEEHGCPQCQYENFDKRSGIELKEYLLSNNIVVLNPDEYSEYNLGNLHIVCSNCGNTFTTSLNTLNRLIREKRVPLCSSCSKSESSGERKIREFLISHNIEFIQEKRFVECKDKSTLPFDFYLPKHNLCIEYMGKQHYTPIDYFGGLKEFKIRKLHDEYKKEFCSNNEIGYLEIPYTDYEKIADILDNQKLT